MCPLKECSENPEPCVINPSHTGNVGDNTATVFAPLSADAEFNSNNHPPRTWQGLQKLGLQILTKARKQQILNNQWLRTEHMTALTPLVQNLPSFYHTI